MSEKQLKLLLTSSLKDNSQRTNAICRVKALAFSASFTKTSCTPFSNLPTSRWGKCFYCNAVNRTSARTEKRKNAASFNDFTNRIFSFPAIIFLWKYITTSTEKPSKPFISKSLMILCRIILSKFKLPYQRANIEEYLSPYLNLLLFCIYFLL